ncbi:6-phosphofructo-2-kinase [Drechslerella dactyloides]|uniref:6-phosphofructo-2-kinase n=1 Tax=Drechslerella dactyloides TaxID=74499 RepID=A0AAD6IQH3_DREDA|nr:6-phosphofructo-2-kinase [Drechslerella dactyloides]
MLIARPAFQLAGLVAVDELEPLCEEKRPAELARRHPSASTALALQSAILHFFSCPRLFRLPAMSHKARGVQTTENTPHPPTDDHPHPPSTASTVVATSATAVNSSNGTSASSSPPASPELLARPSTVPGFSNGGPQSITVVKLPNGSQTAAVPIIKNVPSKPSGKHSDIAKTATIASTKAVAASSGNKDMLLPPSIQVQNTAATSTTPNGTPRLAPIGAGHPGTLSPMKSSDTPLLMSTPSSPRLHATTLNIPGLTKSKVSEDGRIPARDIGSKLIIVMVGLPARGKSYITRKLARYLGWLQYDVKVFNVGNRRRIAANQPQPPTPPDNGPTDVVHQAFQVLKDVKLDQDGTARQPFRGTGLLASFGPQSSPPKFSLDAGNIAFQVTNLDEPKEDKEQDSISQSAEFFDPSNVKAKKLRERVAMETLDEALDYVLNGEGSIAILDATNSTIERRSAIVDHIREAAGYDLGILFIESICEDEQVLEANMRLKLSGPDYKGLDPEKSYEDFKKRVKMYEGAYVPIGDYEEKKGWAYLKLIDVGRKFIAHGIRGFLANHTAYYLMNFNLASRQIWITRHGESMDNVQGRIGGNSNLSEKGDKYARALASFIQEQRKLFHAHEIEKYYAAQLPPRAGNITPPNPDATMNFGEDDPHFPVEKPFCVWTSMLNRSVETARYFNDEEYDIKQWRMLDELNAGLAEGKTYDEIRRDLPGEYENRIADKLHYRYPGPGGESYLDVIHRIKEIIIEVERTTDHVLIVAHRVVARVLLGYYTGQHRDKVANLDVPLGMVFSLEPRPYGVELKAFKYDLASDQFYHVPDFELRTTTPEKSEREVMV